MAPIHQSPEILWCLRGAAENLPAARDTSALLNHIQAVRFTPLRVMPAIESKEEDIALQHIQKLSVSGGQNANKLR